MDKTVGGAFVPTQMCGLRSLDQLAKPALGGALPRLSKGVGKRKNGHLRHLLPTDLPMRLHDGGDATRKMCGIV